MKNQKAKIATTLATTLATMDELVWQLGSKQYATREQAISQDDEGTCEGWDLAKRWTTGNVAIREWRSDRNHLSISGIGVDKEATERAVILAFNRTMAATA